MVAVTTGASSVNQAISFREEADEDTRLERPLIFFLPFSRGNPSTRQISSSGLLSFVEESPLSLRFLLPGAKLFFFLFSSIDRTEGREDC